MDRVRDAAAGQPRRDDRGTQLARHLQPDTDLDMRHVIAIEHHVGTAALDATGAKARPDLVAQPGPDVWEVAPRRYGPDNGSWTTSISSIVTAWSTVMQD